MNRKIIFSSIVMVFIFSGCLGFGDAKPTIDKVDKKVQKVDKSAKKTEKVIKDIKKEVKSKKDEIAKPEESNLQDVVIENEVDISDDGTSISKPQLIESVD